MITYVCPHCGATLAVQNPAQDFLVCEYCGAMLPLSVRIDPNTNTYSAAPPSSSSEAEVLDVFLRHLGALLAHLGHGLSILAAKARQKPKQALVVVLSVLILTSGSAFAYRHYHEAQQTLSAHQARLNELGAEQEKFAHQAKGEAFLPQSLPTTGDYRDPYKKLRDAGFTDITLDPKKDLVLGHFESENAIVEITVDGSPVFETGVWIEADTPIVITYHTFLWNRSAPSGPLYPSSSEN